MSSSTLGNAFKNKNTRNASRNDNGGNINYFKSTNKLEQKFIKKESDFPDLLKSNAILCNNLQNYKNAIQTEINNDIDVDEVAEGFVCLTQGNNNEIIIKYGKQIIPIHNPNNEYNMNDAINDMIVKWNKYKTDYIELYGEDEYNRLYVYIPVYEDDDDDSECDECDEWDDDYW
jgi:hypothetical protein